MYLIMYTIRGRMPLLVRILGFFFFFGHSRFNLCCWFFNIETISLCIW